MKLSKLITNYSKFTMKVSLNVLLLRLNCKVHGENPLRATVIYLSHISLSDLLGECFIISFAFSCVRSLTFLASMA